MPDLPAHQSSEDRKPKQDKRSFLIEELSEEDQATFLNADRSGLSSEFDHEYKG